MTSKSLDEISAGARSASPLRILVVVDGYYPATGGAEKQARLLSRAFADAGHDVQVVTPLLDGSLPRADEIDEIPVTRLSYPRIKLVGAMILCARYGAWIWSRRAEFDAIHVHMAKNLAAMSGLLRPLLPATVTVKISGAWEFNGGILDPELRRRVSNRVYNWCIKRVDSLQCISEYTRSMLRDAGYPEDMLLMVPNAVDLTRFAPRPRARVASAPARVSYVGRLRAVKGVSVLVDAWSRLAGAGDAQLTIAGDGPEREALMRSAEEKGLAGRIDFLGEVSDVPEVLGQSDIYVQPSLQEGLPNAVLEAMAMGLPIVATRISGNEDVVVHEENGLLVPPGDPEALAAALRRLIIDPSLAGEMGRRSRDMVQDRFGLPAVLRRLERAFRGEPRPGRCDGTKELLAVSVRA